jgi:hypothetical protein
LQFKQNGKGLAVSGPLNFQSMPDEFTISFWMFPTSLNFKSTFLNAFNRVRIFGYSSNLTLNYYYTTGPSGPTSVKYPPYTPAN